jgi:hypothetical protein
VTVSHQRLRRDKVTFAFHEAVRFLVLAVTCVAVSVVHCDVLGDFLLMLGKPLFSGRLRSARQWLSTLVSPSAGVCTARDVCLVVSIRTRKAIGQ